MADNWSSFIEDVISWGLTNAIILIVFALIYFRFSKAKDE